MNEEKVKVEDLEIEYNQCKQLACSVIKLALDDAISYEVTKFNFDMVNYRMVKSEAVLFCASTHGEFKRSREFWSAIAGINPDSIAAAFHKWKDNVKGYREANGKYKKIVRKQDLSKAKYVPATYLSKASV